MLNVQKIQIKHSESQNTSIHQTAILEGNITIDEDVNIGPYCILQGNIHIKKGVQLLNNVVILGNTTIGEDTVIHSFSVIGSAPQDLKYKNEESFTSIGKNNIIREYVTINAGTQHGGLHTVIGDNNLLMINSHVGHDCKIQNHCIISNNVALAGHVMLDDYIIIGGNSGIHQFVRIGKYSMIGGMSGLGVDIPPFCMYTGIRTNEINTLNIIGLKRHGFSSKVIKEIKSFYQLYLTGSLHESKITELQEKYKEKNYITDILSFIQKQQNRNMCIWNEK